MLNYSTTKTQIHLLITSNKIGTNVSYTEPTVRYDQLVCIKGHSHHHMTSTAA